MRQTSALARLAARLCGRKADAVSETPATVNEFGRCRFCDGPLVDAFCSVECSGAMRELDDAVGGIITPDDRELDWRPGGYHFPRGRDSMRPRSYISSRGSAMPVMATRRPGPITENKTRGNLKHFRRHGSNPLPPEGGRQSRGYWDPPPAPPPARVLREGAFPYRPAIRGSTGKIAGMMSTLEVHERCEYVVGSVQCDRERDHGGGHLFKCAGDYCPGLPWIGSNTPHPTSCTMPRWRADPSAPPGDE